MKTTWTISHFPSTSSSFPPRPPHDHHHHHHHRHRRRRHHHRRRRHHHHRHRRRHRHHCRGCVRFLLASCRLFSSCTSESVSVTVMFDPIDGSALTFVSPDVALVCLRDGSALRLYSLEIHDDDHEEEEYDGRRRSRSSRRRSRGGDHYAHSSTRHCLSLASLGRVVVDLVMVSCLEGYGRRW